MTAAAAVPALDEHDAWVVLAGARGVGPVSFARLVATFGSAAAVLEAASEPGAVPRLIEASAGTDAPPALTVVAAATVIEAAEDPQRALSAVRRVGVTVVTLRDGAYPRRLREIDLPPPVLFVAGEVAALSPERAVALVGTRRPTSIGRATAGRIAEAIGARGVSVVSGLAFGIDAAAHHAAVRRGVPTVAVIGGGHEHLYPAGHRGLALSIVAGGGAVVSEFAPDVAPSRGTFPRRNRIISGLSDATVVVEAGARSGALTTAAWALEQGRSLFIVPGRLDDPAVAGSLAFLREAGPEAKVVAGIAELVEDLGLAEVGPSRVPREPGSRAALGATESEVAGALRRGAGSPDDIVAATGLPGAAVLAALTTLELRGLVIEVLGRYQPSGRLADRPTRLPRRIDEGTAGRPAA
ncbi:MAG TPA: DNA-processing protein DprA [Candidatus Limnocylindrales bacterium]